MATVYSLQTLCKIFGFHFKEGNASLIQKRQTQVAKEREFATCAAVDAGKGVCVISELTEGRAIL